MAKLPAHPSLTYGLAELATRVNNDHTQSTELLWLFNVIYHKERFRIYSGKLEGTTIFVSVLLLLGPLNLALSPLLLLLSPTGHQLVLLKVFSC